MNDKEYLNYCRELLAEFATGMVTRTNHLPENDTLRTLAQSFAGLNGSSDDFYIRTPDLVDRLFTTYPDFAPTFPRPLLWFLGGDCLHFMADEEIEQFQQLEDMRQVAVASGEPFNFRDARAKLLNLQ